MTIRVILADDHAVFRSGLKSLLQSEEDIVVVGEAESGDDALGVLSTIASDVLVLDVSMPGTGSAEVARHALREHPELAIVVLTMHEDDRYLQEFFRIGVRAYVLKKSTAMEVVQAIHAAVAGKSYIDPAMASHVISAYVRKSPGRSGRRPDSLTARETEICRLLALGHTHSEIADALSISDRTVESHRQNIMAKLDLHSRAELVRYALQNGLMGASDRS